MQQLEHLLCSICILAFGLLILYKQCRNLTPRHDLDVCFPVTCTITHQYLQKQALTQQAVVADESDLGAC